ncbi:MAG: nitrilase-related carbon-nitrogen hydrolase [Blastocatellia bacterium]
MNVTCVQINGVWENKAASHDRARRLIDLAAPAKGSLVVLSEMFATGFSMNAAAITDSESHETQNFLSRIAIDHNVYVTGGVVTSDTGGRGRNESVTYNPEGVEIARYCKMQPFTPAGESDNYVAGPRPMTFTCQEFTIAPFICYDLRFPEHFRAAVRMGANLYTVIASWPSYREQHWMTLLRARAIENQAYVVGVNRTGHDSMHPHSGRSMIIDPRGEILADAGNGECVISATLDLQALLDYRKQFPFLADMRADSV